MQLIQRFFGSITNRVFLLLALGIVVAIFVTFSLAMREDRQTMQTMRNEHEAERVAQFVRLMESVPDGVRTQIAQSGMQIGLHATLSPPQPMAAQEDDSLIALLRSRLPKGVVLRQAGANTECRRPETMAPGFFRGGPASPEHQSCHLIDLTLSDGTPLHLTLGWSAPPPGEQPPPPRTNFPWHWLVFFSLIALLAYLGARMIVKPLRRMTYLAEELGRNIDRPPLPEEGPSEIRHAIAAVNGMQVQIRRHIEQRMFMLSAIAHDLQTPLTRLRLRLEKVNDETLRKQLLGDLAAMQQMVREGLDFARSMNSVETFQNIDIDSLLETLCADAADAGQDVSFAGHTGATVQASVSSLKRCIANLMDNAVKYGEYARVEATLVGKQVEVRVSDGGPGVPANLLESVFDPFFRVENSRSRETGGVGLGLAIARNIAQKHGGKLRLENGSVGAVAVLTLPVAKQV
ncbi:MULTISPECIES: sensor histidine kinase [Silvimonas]|uniref:sensor histidine kinase n=1 Tax=Silvimonas TaxID=300264 RepID=UPI0024B3250F|nr:MULTISPECIES: HAMP domain-containing sensor histidine kinase [Silvimonas]MDR3429275.1 HAMP domain-containing sensor histidine kinase [Silvimonas sp.]